MLFALLMLMEPDLACMRAVSSAELTQASVLVTQNESSCLSKELSP